MFLQMKGLCYHMDDLVYGKLKYDSYTPRILDRHVAFALEDFGGVNIRGPKYCGKTWTGRAFSNSETLVMSAEGATPSRDMIEAAPELALQGASPHLIDEWQEIPQLWDMARSAIDASGKARTFVLTGSSTPRERKPKHSGVGRIERLHMRPMTLLESGESEGSVSIRALCSGESPQAAAPKMSADKLADLIVRGGWPGNLSTPTTRAGRLARDYVELFLEEDMHKVDNVRRDSAKMRRLMVSYARNAEQAATPKTLIRDMTAEPGVEPLSKETVQDYTSVLEDTFILEEIGPWSPNLRSPLRINKKPKYHYADPSIPAALLKLTPGKLLGDFETFGFLFESLCMRDLLVYVQEQDGDVFFYRDRDDLEVDAIVETADGAWAGIEVKIGHNQVEKAATSLLRLSAKIERAGGAPPAFLAVVEGLGDYAYRRTDGVHVVPITCLAP